MKSQIEKTLAHLSRDQMAEVIKLMATGFSFEQACERINVKPAQHLPEYLDKLKGFLSKPRTRADIIMFVGGNETTADAHLSYLRKFISVRSEFSYGKTKYWIA